MTLSPLQQVNAIIGLSKRIAGWPSTLADHRYSLDRIELKFKIPNPAEAGASIFINPDLLFVSDERNASLIVELKSGSYREHDLEQLSNLERVTPLQLVRDGRVTLHDVSSVLTHKISIMLMANHVHLDAFLAALRVGPIRSCLVGISDALIKTALGDLTDAKLDVDFKTGINIERSYVPTRLIRVLPNTNETKDLKRCIVETVRDCWVNNERSVTPGVIAARLFRDGMWKLFDSDAQQQFLRIANAVLKDMRETEFYRYLARDRTDPQEWRLLKLPELEGKNLGKAYRTFQKAVREYKTRLQNDVEYPDRHKDQLKLEDVEGFMP